LAELESLHGAYGGQYRRLELACGQIHQLREWLIALEGQGAELMMIQIAKRQGLKVWRKRLETEALSVYSSIYFGGVDGAGRDWWLDKRADPLLDYLTQQVENWRSDMWRALAFLDLAVANYRRYGRHAPDKCWQWFARFQQLPPRLLEEFTRRAHSDHKTAPLLFALKACNDEETWLAILPLAPNQSPQWLEFWKWRRSDPAQRDAIAMRVLQLLRGTENPNAVALILEMVSELSPAELRSHRDLVTRNLSHPRPEVAAWGIESVEKASLPLDVLAEAIEHPATPIAKATLEKLVKSPPSNLDWPRSIEAAGEKLWSENAGLSKIAARFLGTAPRSASAAAWAKLSEALELENLALVEASARALAVLKTTNPALSLEAAALSRLEALADLAPERFEKIKKRLHTAL